jgi:putative PEP-CTERM system TPR-repeat lipoprotein
MQNRSIKSFSALTKLSLKRLVVVLSVVFFVSACAEKTSEEHIQEAKQFVDNGNKAAAVVALKNAVQKNTRSPQARFELGKLYLDLKDYESAEKELTRAQEFGYPENEIIPLLAEALDRSGANVALTELDFGDATLTAAEQLEVGYRQIQSLVQLDKRAEAQTLIRELLTLNSDTVYKGLVEAYQLVLDDEIGKALEIATAMYERAPLNRDVLNLTARLNMVNGNAETAATIYKDYIDVATDDVEAKFALANMLIEQRKPVEAEILIDELLTLGPDNALLNQLKGVVRASSDDYVGAKEYSEKAIGFGRNDPSVRLVAGLASYQLEEFEDAIMHLSSVASFLPDNHPGLRILAASQLQVNMGDDAGEVLNRVGNISNTDASLFSRAGYELLRSGNTEAAKDVIAQADKISESSEDLTRLGVLKLSINDIEGLVDLESAVEKAPDSVTAKTTLASAYLGTNQLDNALKLAKEWQQEEPGSIEAMLLETEVLQRQERFAEASVVLTKAAAIEPDNGAVRMSAIRMDLREQKYDDALIKTNSLLEDEPTNVAALASLFALKNEQNDPGPAIDKIVATAEANPNNQNIALLSARILIAAGQHQQAIDIVDNIAADRQAPPSFWKIKGVALLRSGQTNDALRHYEAWAENYPNQEGAAIGRLVLHDSKREYAKGASVAAEFLDRKDNVQVKLMHSYFLVMSGEEGRARRVLNSLDNNIQAVPFARGVKARISIAEGKASQAVDDAFAAYSATKNGDNLFVYVTALDAANQSATAFEAIQQHTIEFPNDGRIKLLLAERQISDDKTKALQTYEEMLQKFPNNMVILNNAAYIHMEKGNLTKAAEYAAKAYEIGPDKVAVADTYAQVLFRQGQVQEAVDIYDDVMRQQVTDDNIWVNYIEALLTNGDKDKAQRRLGTLRLESAEAKARLEALKSKFLG